MTFDDLDELSDSLAAPKPNAVLPHQWLANGHYTITFPCGTHRTLRIHTQRQGPLKNKRLVSLLIGPHNSSDYEVIAHLTDDEPYIWKRYQNHRSGEYVALLWMLVKGEQLEDHILQSERHCLRCNRLLTHPDSITDNLGPECRKLERGNK